MRLRSGSLTKVSSLSLLSLSSSLTGSPSSPTTLRDALPLCSSMPYLLVCQSYVVSWHSLSHIHMSPTASHYQYAFCVQCRFSDGVIRSLLFLSVPDTLFTARLEMSVSYRNLWKHLFWLYVATDGYFSLVSLCSLKL